MMSRECVPMMNVECVIAANEDRFNCPKRSTGRPHMADTAESAVFAVPYFFPDSGIVFLCRAMRAISSGAKTRTPFLRIARTFPMSTSARISISGMPNVAAASRRVFIGNGMMRHSFLDGRRAAM